MKTEHSSEKGLLCEVFCRLSEVTQADAGLWEHWRDPAADVVETCTILTVKPNSLAAEVHDRMPVILRAEDYDLWLDPGVTDAAHVTECLRPFDARLMKKYPRVNRPENDDDECAREVLPAVRRPFMAHPGPLDDAVRVARVSAADLEGDRDANGDL